MVLEQNLVVDAVLPGATMRALDDEEMATYRRPFANPGEDRRTTLSMPRQIPIDGEPAEVVEIVESYGEWLADCAVPKLFIDADLGAILTGGAREFCRSWPNQTEVTVPGLHFPQEDGPDEVGAAIAEFVRRVRRQQPEQQPE
jgi:haloalkane dehalogenase